MAKNKDKDNNNTKPTVEVVRFISMDHDLSCIMELESETVVAGRVVRKPLKYLQFNGPYYQTSDPDEIKHLRGLDSFGKRIFENVIPEDMVATGVDRVIRYACPREDCDFVGYSKEAVREHRKEAHPKRSKPTKEGDENGDEGSEGKDMVD